jgi:hypothetical protein
MKLVLGLIKDVHSFGFLNCSSSFRFLNCSSSGSSDVSRQRVSIQGLRSSGHAPGRCSYSVFFIPASMSGVSCSFFKPFRQWGSSSSGAAMGSSSGGGGQRWFEGGCRWSLLVASRAFGVVFVFFGVLCVRWVGQLCLYPPRTFLVS